MEGTNLKTRNPADRIALRGVRMHAVLAGMSQKTLVEQTFVNREQHAIEAVYTFPLPDGAAVCAFEVVTGDHVLTGVIEETDDAIDKYESAIDAGDAAYLAEQERPDVFTIRVGNIKPQQAAAVRLTYICPLEITDNRIRVTFPTTVAPRFNTNSGTHPVDAAIDGDALNPPHVLSVPYGLTFSADIKLGRKVKILTSPTHSIQVSGEDSDGYHAVLHGTVAMDREVVLEIELAKEFGPCVQVENGPDNQSYLAVTFVPELEVDTGAPPARETVFVLDCSGSMAGSSMEQATAALELCLRSLNVGDTFNICKFGSGFELMTPEPLVYSQATLEQAIAYIASGNDMGGTELLHPLEAVLQIKPAVGVVRSVILLTDGQMTNEPAILKLARQHRGRNRIFSFGIGPASSSFLVKGLARATGGAAEFITGDEMIHERVLRTFARLTSPLASDVQIDWGGTEAQTLAELPPVFDGDVLTVFARVLGRRPTEVVLKCRTDASEQSWPVPVPTTTLPDCGIATMWARRTIQSLEEVNGITRSAAPGAASRERTLLISLSKQFGLLSSLTTYVAVEHRSIEERNGGQPATRRVPVMLASGWGGNQTMRCLTAGAAPAAGRTIIKAKRRNAGSGLLDLRRERDDSGLDAVLEQEIEARVGFAPGSPAASSAAPATPANSQGFMHRLFGKTSSVDKAAYAAKDAAAKSGKSAGRPRPGQNRIPSSPNPAAEVSEILLRQSAAGDFGWDQRLDQIASTVHGWTDLAAKAELWVPVETVDRGKVVSTVQALVLLRTKFAADEAVWKRAAEKAVRYVAKSTQRTVATVLAHLRKPQ
jgi:Ca-activated chloride channel family protein